MYCNTLAEYIDTFRGIPGPPSMPALTSCDVSNVVCPVIRGSYIEHIVHSDCSNGVLVEHYGLEFGGHSWPEDIAGTETYQLVWQFLIQFTIDQIGLAVT